MWDDEENGEAVCTEEDRLSRQEAGAPGEGGEVHMIAEGGGGGGGREGGLGNSKQKSQCVEDVELRDVGWAHSGRWGRS